MGTRLREVTESIPKPLVDIGEQPILWHIMKTYEHYGFRRFILCLGYKSWEIKEYFIRYREFRSDFTIRLHGEHELQFHDGLGNEDWEIICTETGLTSGTGGPAAPRAALHRHGDVHVHVRGRHRQRSDRSTPRIPPPSGAPRDGHRGPTDIPIRRDQGVR